MATQIQLTDQEQLAQVLSTKKLSPQQLNWISTVLFPLLQNKYTPEKVPNAEYALTLVRSNPEIALSLFAKKQDTGTQVEGALLANLVAEMNQDKEKIAQSLNAVYANLPPQEQDYVKLLIANLQNQKLQEKAAANPKVQNNLKQAQTELNPKQSINSHQKIDELSDILIEAIDKGQKLNLSPPLKEEIKQELTQTIVANPKAHYQQETTPLTQQEIIALAIATIAINTNPTTTLPNNPIAETARALNNFREVSPQDYTTLINTPNMPLPDHIYFAETNQVLKLPPQEKIATIKEVQNTIEATIQTSAPFLLTEKGKDALENAIAQAEKLATLAQDSPPLLDATEETISPIINAQVEKLTQVINLTNPTIFTHSKPNQEASKAATILEETGNPNDKNLAAATQLASMGLTTQTLTQIAITAQDKIKAGQEDELTKFYLKNQDLFQLKQQLQQIESSENFKQEIHQDIGRFKAFRTTTQSLYNKASARLPVAITRPLNVVFHPIASFKAWAGRRAGKYIASQVIKRVPYSVLKKVLKTSVGKVFLKQGVKQGTKWLLKQGLKWGIKGAAYLAGIATGPFAPLVAIAVEVADFVYSKILKPLVKFALAPITGIITDIFGKPNLKEDVPAAILGTGAAIGGAFSAIPAVFAAAGSAAFAATTAAGTTIIIASGITLIFYLAAFNMGPIIASLAQMGMPITGGVNFPSQGGSSTNDFDMDEIPDPPDPPPGTEDSISPEAQRAHEIVSQLRRGFWGYWNNYPGFFNQEMFDEDPNPPYPGPIQNDPNNLFWCTQLIALAYGGSPPGGSYMADTMMSNIGATPTSNLTYQDVKSGDIVFFDTNPNDNRPADHVGIVYAVTADGITFLQSNAATIDGTITVSTDGSIQNLPGIKVVAFGRP